MRVVLMRMNHSCEDLRSAAGVCVDFILSHDDMDRKRVSASQRGRLEELCEHTGGSRTRGLDTLSLTLLRSSLVPVCQCDPDSEHHSACDITVSAAEQISVSAELMLLPEPVCLLDLTGLFPVLLWEVPAGS